MSTETVHTVLFVY